MRGSRQSIDCGNQPGALPKSDLAIAPWTRVVVSGNFAGV